MTRREYRYHLLRKNRKRTEKMDYESAGWICNCGHWVVEDLHCTVCGNPPPWGCDCSFCNDFKTDIDDYWEDAEDSWQNDPFDMRNIEATDKFPYKDDLPF